MKHTFFLTLICVAFAMNANAQEEVYSSSGRPLRSSEKNEKNDKLIDPDRMIFGGWGVFGIGSGMTNIGITPIFGYRITDQFSAGIGFGYQYLHIKNYNTVIVDVNTAAEEYRPLQAHIYSPSIWARHIIWNNIFAHVEYEHNIFSQTSYTNDYTQWGTLPVIKDKQTINVPCLLTGAGLRLPLSDRAAVIMMVLYDVLQDKNSPYRNTLAIRVGINAGF